MDWVFTPDEKRHIDELLKKHRPQPGEEKTEKEKEITVTSQKGTKIVVKSETVGPSSKPFKERTPEKVEEACQREYEIIGTDIEPEYDDIDTEEEKAQVDTLTEGEMELFHQFKEFYTIQGRTKGKMPGFQYIHRPKVKDRYLWIPTDIVEMLSHPQEGEIQDIEQITEKEAFEIKKHHAVVSRRRVNIRPGKRTVVLCIDPDSDSDIAIEEGEMDFKTWCLIVKEEEKDHESEGQEGDDEQSEQPTETATEQEGASQTTEQRTDIDVDETISRMLTQDFDWEVVKKEVVNLAQQYQNILDSFARLVKEVPHMSKRQLATHMAGTPILLLMKVTTEEKISSMYGQRYWTSKSTTAGESEEFDPKVYGTMDEEKVQSVWNTIGDCSTLLLLAIGECVINKRSQVEIAKKYGIPKSWVQWKKHKKVNIRKGVSSTGRKRSIDCQEERKQLQARRQKRMNRKQRHCKCQ